MTGRLVLLLFAFSPVVIGESAHDRDLAEGPRYVPTSICGISFHHEKANPKYISVDAEYLSAIPHGVFLMDRECPNKVLPIDFPDTGLDPSVALIRNHLFEIHRAKGTFRGFLRRDRSTKRLYLWLQSVDNFESADYLPELHNAPIQLPEPPLPKLPPKR